MVASLQYLYSTNHYAKCLYIYHCILYKNSMKNSEIGIDDKSEAQIKL